MATPQQIAISALLHRSPVILPIPGASSKENLRENWGAGKILLDDSDIKKLWN